MKYILITASLITTLSTISVAQAKLNKIYSNQNYPYKQLIHRSESVKLIYSENQASITCKVAVQHKENLHQTAPLEVSKQKFSAAPLASCLPRQQAKALLASTFK
ncbi:hypothetical protein [Paraglaciecola aestuariivivens]